MAGILTFGGNLLGAVLTTAYYGLGVMQGGQRSATELNVTHTARTAGTYSQLQGFVSVNGSSSVVLRFRVNAANGNQLISPGAATGYFEDTTNSDVIAAGDTVDLIYTAANTNAVTINTVASLFTATSGYSTRIGAFLSAGLSLTAASTNNFVFAFQSMSAGATETSYQAVQSAATQKNLYAYVSSNARTTTVDIRSRVNTTNGNLLIQYTSGQTGVKEDTSNTDTLAQGDLIDYVITTAAIDTNAIVVHQVSSDLYNASTPSVPWPSTPSNSQLTGVTNYLGISGRQDARSATEANHALQPKQAGSLKNASQNVTVNAGTTATTWRTRINSSNGNILVTATALTTGVFVDNTNVDTVAATDVINWSCTTGATGGTNFRSCITFEAAVGRIFKLAGDGGGLAGASRGLAA